MGIKWASWAGKAEPFRTAERQSRIEHDGFPLIRTALASCRQMPPGWRRYVVHPIAGNCTNVSRGPFQVRLVVLFLLFLLTCSPARAQIVDRHPAPVIATSADGTPIRAYGDLYVYDVSPDFQPANEIQAGNKSPKTKVQPKKSWEIGDNFFGATPSACSSQHPDGQAVQSAYQSDRREPQDLLGKPRARPAEYRAGMDSPRFAAGTHDSGGRTADAG